MQEHFKAWWDILSSGWTAEDREKYLPVAKAAYARGQGDPPEPRAKAAVDFEYPTAKPLTLGLTEAAAPAQPEAPAVHALMEFRGHLMIATSAGLFELDPMANTAYRVPLHNDTTRSREG